MSKFASKQDEMVYALTLDSRGSDSGNVEAPTGWFCTVDLNEPGDDTAAAIAHYGSPFVIVREDQQGFVSVIGFPDKAARDEAFEDLDHAYMRWDAEVTEVEYLSAVSGYERCALWSSIDEEGVPLDDERYEYAQWSEAQHRQNLADVSDFLTSNIEHVRAYIEVLGVDFGQVGHDFWLTRNRHGAGFWDRGAAGPAVDALVESSDAWGGVDLFITNNEIGA